MAALTKAHRRIRQWLRTAIFILLLMAGSALILHAMGRPFLCTCGTVRLWQGVVQSSENSQQLSDWYSFSHIIHGFLFFGGGWLLLRKWPVQRRLLLAVTLESGWELLENSPLIIHRYREATIAYGYSGDSVLNSMSDIVMMILGFLFAARVPVRLTLLVAIAFELMTLAIIRDNLTLNVLMLLHPVEAIKVWQTAG